MPIIKQTKVGQHMAFALWQITESEDELLAKLSLNTAELNDLNAISHLQKRREWLGARNALKSLLKPYGQFFIHKDENGKPFLDDPHIGISMSHAGQYGAAAIHFKGLVGIDVEIERSQVVQIAQKFLHAEEMRTVPKTIEELTRIWSAKEALYKMFGRKQLTFGKDMIVEAAPNEEIELFKRYAAKYKEEACFTFHYCPKEGLHITLATPADPSKH